MDLKPSEDVGHGNTSFVIIWHIASVSLGGDCGGSNGILTHRSGVPSLEAVLFDEGSEDLWGSFPIDEEPRPLVLLGSRVRARGFPDSKTKLAFINGAIEAEPVSPRRVRGNGSASWRLSLTIDRASHGVLTSPTEPATGGGSGILYRGNPSRCSRNLRL